MKSSIRSSAIALSIRASAAPRQLWDAVPETEVLRLGAVPLDIEGIGIGPGIRVTVVRTARQEHRFAHRDGHPCGFASRSERRTLYCAGAL